MTGAHAPADRPAGMTSGRTDPSARSHRSPDSGAWSAVVDQLVRGTRGAEEVTASLIGRWPRSRLLHQYVLSSIDDPGRTLLQTSGPAVGRDLELVNPDPPGAVVATSTELIVPARLPRAVAADLPHHAEPLERLLDRHGVDWDSQILRTTPTPDNSALRVLRLIWLDSLIGALVSDDHQLDADQTVATPPPEPAC